MKTLTIQDIIQELKQDENHYHPEGHGDGPHPRRPQSATYCHTCYYGEVIAAAIKLLKNLDLSLSEVESILEQETTQ